MGSHLACPEGRVAFEELLRRLPDYALEKNPSWQPSPWARAYAAMPIGFSPQN